MHNPSARTERCTILRSGGDFCDLESIEDTPFPICGKHALRLYRHLINSGAEGRAAMFPSDKSGAPDSRTLLRLRNDAIRSIQAGETIIYAVQFPDDGVIKIGATTNLAQRLANVCKGSGQLVGLMHGGFDLEREIHANLSEHVHHGREYYNAVPEVIAIVNEMRDGFGMPHLDAA